MAGDKSNAWISTAVLAGLVVQNTSVVLLMRYIRLPENAADGEVFISSTIVLTTEITKFLMCVAIVAKFENESIGAFVDTIRTEILGHPKPFMLMCVPSLIYVVQNNLLYIAISNLEAAVFQVTYQLKLFLAAVCAKLFLGKQMPIVRWIAVFVLFLGVVLVQLPSESGEEETTVDTPEISTQYLITKIDYNTMVGIASAVGGAFLSALAGTYIEFVMKGDDMAGMKKQSLWMKNLQLAFFSLFFGAMACFVKDGAEIQRRGFFAGYDRYVIITVVLQACGGLLIGAVLKYASNVAKGFATSISMVISSVLSMWIFAFEPNSYFVGGAMLVVASVVFYSNPELASCSKKTKTGNYSQVPSEVKINK